MATFYHGSSALFPEFDLSHVLEGAAKVKFGFGVYLTSSYKSAAHYSGANKDSLDHYVYTVEIPEITPGNHIAFKQPVDPVIAAHAADKLCCPIPYKATLDGKEFRKFLAKKLGGSTDIKSEKLASEFLDSIGVKFIIWPYNWRNPSLGTNVAVLNDRNVRIVKVDRVQLDQKQQLISGSEIEVKP